MAEAKGSLYEKKCYLHSNRTTSIQANNPNDSDKIVTHTLNTR